MRGVKACVHLGVSFFEREGIPSRTAQKRSVGGAMKEKDHTVREEYVHVWERKVSQGPRRVPKEGQGERAACLPPPRFMGAHCKCFRRGKELESQD